VLRIREVGQTVAWQLLKAGSSFDEVAFRASSGEEESQTSSSTRWLLYS